MIDGLFYFMAFAVFLIGACVGSFLNVCIYRIPRDQSIVWPRSRCPYCLKTIAWYDNIPLVSYFLLRGRCRHCKGSISPRYLLVEGLTGALFLLIALEYGATPLTPLYWTAAAGLIVAGFVDFEFNIIPDRVSWGGIAAGLALSAAFPALHHDGSLMMADRLDALRASAMGAGIGFGTLWAVRVAGRAVLKKEAMGFGDVKLMGAIGAFLGWEAVLFVIFVSSLIGALTGVLMILGRLRDWQSRIPYGPFISFAGLLWLIVGRSWWAAYTEWMFR